MNTKYKYIEAPEPLSDRIDLDLDRIVFLAGSITGAENWQKRATETLLPHFNIVNPRRQSFDVSRKDIEEEQITWEYGWLRYSNILLFHFSHETVAPITLFEYGAALEWARNYKWIKIYVSIHSDYSRKNDVVIQTRLRNPEVSKNIYFSLDECLENMIKDHE